MKKRKINTKQLTAVMPKEIMEAAFFTFVIIVQNCKRITLGKSPIQKQRRKCCMSKLKRNKFYGHSALFTG